MTEPESLTSQVFETVNDIRTKFKWSAIHVAAVLGYSNLIAQADESSRAIWLDYMDHVGNATYTFVTAAVAAYAVSKALHPAPDPFGIEGAQNYDLTTLESTVVASSAMTGQVVNQLLEIVPNTVDDPKDLAAGMIGAAIGASSIRHDQFEE